MISELPPAHQPAVASLVASGKLGSRALESLCTLSKANQNVPIDEVINQIEHRSLKPYSHTTEVQAPGDTVALLPNSRKDNTTLSTSESQDLIDLIRIAKGIGTQKQNECECLHEDGRCTYWGWEDQESIPKGIGDPVCPAGLEWFIKPSILFCAICSSEAMSVACSVKWKLKDTLLVGVRREFKCDCGAKGFVAVYIKCTKCGKETWRGWWPK
jgi:hypothetical protein